ncbi:hypothetical protein MTP99_002045 [Tenebrio molitor]|nr:hypothetical protein MTP99_002045 [Tenebrio molitor]
MEAQDNSNEPMDVNWDSGNSSSDDDAEEQILISKAEELERQISDNKYLYNAHEELVNLYRKLGDLTSMRLAYERFHEYFPLTPEIWLAWINDEKKLASSESEVKHIFALFDKAVEDYLSVNLWVEYAQYSIGASTLDTTRQILERGLQAAGLHAADGSLLWDTLRELEFAHLSVAEQGTEQWKEQVLKVVEVFRRQLSVPLLDMENTYKEWKEWLGQLPEDQNVKTEPVEWGYNKTIKVLETYRPFEDKLQVTTEETELLQIYKDYIKSLSDPSTILCVYERAVAQMCLNVTIWANYCAYALKLGEAADQVSSRALRNCPWSEDLWILRLRILEHLGREETEVMKCFEQGLSNLGTNQNIELWLSYLEYVNRTSDNKEKLYKSFDQALEQLRYNDEGSAKVTKWYARILAKNGDMPGARRLWKNILKNPKNKGVASIWLEYANLERQHGQPNQLRSLFERALSSCTDWPQYIAEEWLTFERECGTLTDVMKCTEKRNELVKIQPRQQETVVEEHQGKKRKLVSEDREVEVKKPKSEKKRPILKDPTRTVFVSNLHLGVNEKKLKKVFPNAVNIEVVTNRQGKSRCYGYVQFSIEEEVMTALARDRELLDGRPIFISNCKPDRTERKAGFKYSVQVEANKLFVKGLPVDKSEDEVEAIFKEYGATTVRLVRHKSGQSKGLAYVEFPDGSSAKKAIQKTDQMKIGEHTISVAISAPPPKKPALPTSTVPSRSARIKLQVPMIPRTLQVKGGTSNGESKSVVAKSNEDFRKMLLNK